MTPTLRSRESCVQLRLELIPEAVTLIDIRLLVPTQNPVPKRLQSTPSAIEAGSKNETLSMHDRSTNQLLRQIPLSVSPFIHIPTAVTLPYSYQPLPLALPLSTTGTNGNAVPATGSTQQDAARSTGYITSPSGTVSTTPEAIIHSCRSLVQHLQTQQAAAEKSVKEWEQSIDQRELMEKRRVAPGYLDTNLRILEPTRGTTPAARDSAVSTRVDMVTTPQSNMEGEELDRVFGKIGL